MLYITSESDLDLKTGLSVVYFYAHWFVFHSRVAQILTVVEPDFPNIKFFAVDIEAFPSMMIRHKPKFLPALKVFKDEGYSVNTLYTADSVSVVRATLRDIEAAYNGSNDD